MTSMRTVAARRIPVLVLLLGALGAGGALYYYGNWPGKGPAESATSPADPAAAVATVHGVPPPPFRITGTLLSPETKIVHLVILDTARQPQGAPISAKEGETVAAYLVKRIDNHRVYFEREGQLFLMHVGGDQIVQDDAPAPEPVKQKERTANFIPPPENIEEIRKDTAIFIEKLKEQPDFKRALEERKLQRQQQTQTAP